MNRMYARLLRIFRDAGDGRVENDSMEKRSEVGLWKTVALISVMMSILASIAFLSGKGVFDVFAPRGRVVQTATTTLMKMERETQLVTTRAFVQAVVRFRDEQWYGNAEVVRIVPATIHISRAKAKRRLRRSRPHSASKPSRLCTYFHIFEYNSVAEPRTAALPY